MFELSSSESAYTPDYFFAAGEMLGMHVTPPTGSAYNRYFIRDHLGGVAVVTDDTGTVVERDSYDAWGKRRNPNGADDVNGTLRSQTTRGFTGHEMVQDIGLINMNARMYDPLTGRFMSPDSIIPAPFNLQSLNAYSYVLNNPLSATDPTGLKCHGWFGCTFGGFGTPILAIAAAVTLQEWALPELGTALAADGFTTAAAIVSNAALDAVASGALGGAINSDFTWQGALIGGAEAGAFYGVGSATGGHFYNGGTVGLTNGNETLAAWAESPQFEENIVGHGLVGGLASIASGGSFESGFLAAGFGALADPLASVGNNFNQLVISSVAGGTGSVLGGGKFGNGAETGAFGYLFNNAALLFDPNAQDGGQGHLAVAVGDDKTGWEYYSKDGYPSMSDGNQRSWFATLGDLLGVHPRYTNWIQISTTSKQDDLMRTFANRNYSTPYNFCTNNCADLAIGTLRAGGIPIPAGTTLLGITDPVKAFTQMYESQYSK